MSEDGADLLDKVEDYIDDPLNAAAVERIVDEARVLYGDHGKDMETEIMRQLLERVGVSLTFEQVRECHSGPEQPPVTPWSRFVHLVREQQS